MTTNIVACFSCSLDSNGNFKEYPVVSGSVFNEEYNETLDSATLVLSQVSLEDRLTTIQPYVFVRVFDKSGISNFDNIYLVDNFSERENNITDGERLFGYTINLMSETKLLEKVQCPNLTITHKVNSDGTTTKKTILQYIEQYIELYSQRIKITTNDNTWVYQRLIKLPLQTSDLNTYFRSDINNGKIKFTSVGDAFATQGNQSSLSILSFSQTSIGNGQYAFRMLNRSGYTLGFPKGYYFGTEGGKAVLANETFTIEPNTYYTIRTTTGTKTYTMSFGNNKTIKVYGMLYKPEFYSKFNVTCADMAFTAPTLRQLLTTLMQQVSCIPVIKNRTLTYLDFKAEGEEFFNSDALRKTINYIDRSLSSDSFANTLVNMSENVLDSGNEVVCERLGFRDNDSSYIKVEENMKLETKFPIYKIDEVKINIPASMTFTPNASGVNNNSNSQLGTANWPILTNVYYESNRIKLVFKFKKPSNPTLPLYTAYLWADIGLCEGNQLVNKIRLYTNTGIIPGFSHPTGNTRGIYEGTLSFNSDGTGTLQSWQQIASESGDTDQYTLYISIANYPDVNGVWLNMKWYSLPSGDVSTLVAQSFLPLGAKTSTDRTIYIYYRDTDFVEMDETEAYLDIYSSAITDDIVESFSYVDQPDQGSHMWGTQSCTYDPATKKFHYYGECLRSDVIGGRIRINYVGQKSDIQTYNFQCVLQANVTPLFVESSVRQYLNTNFASMTNSNLNGTSSKTCIEKLGEYLYGTVGYFIGGKEITGFSETYNIGHMSTAGWINEGYTYIENILKFLFDHFGEGIFSDSYKINGDMPFWGTVTADQYISSLRPYLWVGNVTFDIKYQPLNSFNLAYAKEKEQLDFPLEQYDSSASGLTDFDRLSLNEQEQVDRIGNEILTISQRADSMYYIRDFSKGPLTYKDNRSSESSEIDYIIFKRTFTIKNYMFLASYTGSKDAVLKDYFTSIRTKYRAYKYVDYEQSVLRKEKDVIFVRFAKNHFNGSNKIKFAGFNSTIEHFIDGFKLKDHSTSGPYSVKYAYEQGKGVNNKSKYSGPSSNPGTITQLVKNDVSKVANDNSIAFIYEQYDNVGAGPRLNNTVVDTSIGGVAQTWQFWNDDFRTSHIVGFLLKLEAPNTYYDSVNQTPYYNFIYKFLTDSYSYKDSLYNRMAGANIQEAINAWPAVVSQVNSSNFFVRQINTVRLPVFEELDNSGTKQMNFFDYSIGFNIIDDINGTLGDSTKRTFYQDYAERLNHTVQFRFYSDTPDMIWTEWFLRNSSVVDTIDYDEDGYGSINVYEITDEEEFEVAKDRPKDGFLLGSISQLSNKIYTYNNGYTFGIRIDWTGTLQYVNAIRITFDSSSTKQHDIVAFRRTNNESQTTFWISLNDTKSEYVLKERFGLLYRAYKTKKNDNSRQLANLED